ncbi:hypothetical protein Taro_034507 [Colocasia esculenta]|uniref:Uncharacterized protein n=1 Tax=Colocasia esculenta TaxID=4460 RepID=A0A843W7U4_COLES|nr:hypothetical protein [Colocasia esculenta]
MDTETPASNGVSGKNANRDKKKAGKVAADGNLKKNANQVDKPSRAKKTIIKKNQAENMNGNGSVSSKVVTGSSGSEEPDFWVPPIGSRWDFDDGKDRWEACSNSSPEKDEDVCEDAQDEAGARDLSARTKRMSIAVGPSSFASKKKKSKKGSAD